jgi:hypothetical protein
MLGEVLIYGDIRDRKKLGKIINNYVIKFIYFLLTIFVFAEDYLQNIMF